MNPKVYLVQGSTGEYDDYRDWIVCAWSTRTQARRHAIALIKRMSVLGDGIKDIFSKETESMREHDPYFSCDYTGTEYDIIEVEVRG